MCNQLSYLNELLQLYFKLFTKWTIYNHSDNIFRNISSLQRKPQIRNTSSLNVKC